MSRSITIGFIGITLFVFLSGCEKYLDFEGEDANPRLVLNGVFTSDSIFTVELSTSSGYITTTPLATIPYGHVLIYGENGQFIDSLHHLDMGIYQGTVKASANMSYSVIATAGELGVVSAKDYLPSAVSITNWDTTTTSITEYDYTSERLQIEYTVNDPADKENFYVLEVYNTIYYYVNGSYDPNSGTLVYDTVYFENPKKERMYFSTSDPILLSNYDVELGENLYYSNSVIYSDRLFNGKTQKFRILIENSYYGGNENIEIHLKSCSESYYKYARTLQNYFYTDGDPFAQPVQVYTNIDNGLGIWAGYSEDVIIL